MINLVRASYQNNLRVPEFVGLSTDGYPDSEDPAVINGAIMHHMDTNKSYKYDEENRAWHDYSTGDYSELEATKMERYIVRLVNTGNGFRLEKYETGEIIAFDTLTTAVRDTKNYVVCVYGNSKLRPQYVSTSEIVFTGLNRDSGGADALRMIVRPTGVQYDSMGLASEASVNSKVSTVNHIAPDSTGNVNVTTDIPEEIIEEQVQDYVNAHSGGFATQTDVNSIRAEIPTKVSELENDSNYVTKQEVALYNDFISYIKESEY